jgi:hypothetical protein
MKVKPMLGDWEIPRIGSIRTLEERSFVELPVPGKVGSLFQDLNTRPTCVVITGSLYGDETRNEFLEKVREKFFAGEPLTFVADIISATEIQYVIIETLVFQENGQRPDETDYRIILRESPPPPPPPDPFGDLELELDLDVAGLLDSLTGALDAIDGLPDLKDPTPPLSNTLSEVKTTMSGLGKIAEKLTTVFGPGK